eukprot:TRINITY_DN6495_c0_g1_i1.p1 TRINITY_DN6495_c0_g1~~TRINITY_DN6495_c0_g1_i1.p1  ORF type:complete len:788 (-),score=264.42 TRINITY_DN6495_c0_g1_i1:1025-3388(-)
MDKRILGIENINDWNLIFPTIEGVSNLGSNFTPYEYERELKLQFFGSNMKATYVTKLVEMNGHALIIWNKKNDPKPLLMFDLKEIYIIQAQRGLPGNTLNDNMIGIISRYHKNLVTGDLDGTTFYLECANEKEKKELLLVYYINLSWAKRYSALFYPRFSAELAYKEPAYNIVMTSTNESYIRSHRYHSKPFVEGEVERKDKLDSKPKKTFVNIIGTSFVYYDKKGGDEKGRIEIINSEIQLICNDVIKKTNENSNWFSIKSGEKLLIFKALSHPELESWCKTLQAITLPHKTLISQTDSKVKELEKRFEFSPSQIRYKLRKYDESLYPTMERKPMPGRPSSPVNNRLTSSGIMNTISRNTNNNNFLNESTSSRKTQNEENEKAKQEIENLKNQLEKQKQVYEKEKQIMEKKISDFEQENENKKKIVENAKNMIGQVKLLKQKHVEREGEKEKLQQELNTLKLENELLKCQGGEFPRDSVSNSFEIDSLRNEKNVLEKSLFEMKEKYSLLERKFEEVSVDVESKDQQIDMLTLEVDSLKNEKNESDLDEKDRQQISSLQDAVQMLEEKIEEMSIENDNKDNQINVLNYELETLKNISENNSAQKNNSSSSALQELQDKVGELQRSLLDLEEKNQDLLSEGESKEQQINMLVLEIDSLKDLANESSKTDQSNSQKEKEYENKIKRLNEKIDELEVTQEELKSKIQEIEEKNQDLLLEGESKEQEISMLNFELETTKNKLEKNKEGGYEFQNKISDSEKKILEAEKKISDLNEKLRLVKQKKSLKKKSY